MQLARRATIPHAVMLLVVAAGALLYGAIGYRGELHRYDAATAAPVADYTVSARREVVAGRRRTQRIDHVLDLKLADTVPGAPARAEVVVTERVYESSAVGSVWQARIVDGQALFDPRLTGVESENRLLLLLLAGGLTVAGAVVWRQARRNQALARGAT